MNNVLVLGAGRVARPLVRHLLSRPNYRVVVASLAPSEGVRRVLAAYPARGRLLEVDAGDPQALLPLLVEADVVVGLVPARLNVEIARLCVREGRPFINTSYTPPEMMELDEPARRRGVLLLNEVGLDPGIDHMSAVRLIRSVRAAGGTVRRLMSCCGGVPAPDANTNPWGYKFSWHPRGVLMAARQPARYLRGGEPVTIPGEELFHHSWPYPVEGLGTFEVYPNRDATHYLEPYRLEGAEGFFRGTVRYPGWCETLRAVAELGLLEVEPVELPAGATWADLTTRRARSGGSAAERAAAVLGTDPDAEVVARLEWAGLLSDRPVGPRRAAPLDMLSERLERLMRYRAGERDLVVLKHTLTAEFPDGSTQILTSKLVATGDPWGDSAMAVTVGLPAAIATDRLLSGRIGAVGVQIPVLPEIYEPVLDQLEELGYGLEESSLTLYPGPLDP
ncbi:MAG: saccharopine dehydrogenase, partial [Nitrospirae bacterium]